MKKGIVNGELKLSMGSQILTAVITEDAVDELDFKTGDTVYALIKPNTVILAK